jgi:AraC-like DNA-binding protein
MMSPKRRAPRFTAADEPFLIVRSSASDVGAGGTIGDHRHDWHQLAYVAAGLVAVDTPCGSWLAPPSWAVWLPVGVAHRLRFVIRSSLRTLYLRPGGAGSLPEDCCALAVSPLLRELILRTVAQGMLDEREAGAAAMAALIRAELSDSGRPPLTLPQPVRGPVRLAADLLAQGQPLAIVARAVGLGARTLERRFRAETGLTLGRWEQQRRLLASLEAIATGQSLKAAAAEAGFASTSAYVAAFGRLFGTTPGRYFTPSSGRFPQAGNADRAVWR